MHEKQWALVTGASSGLGKELGRALAAKKINVVLAARREAPMNVLAAELRQRHGVEVLVEVVDLAAPDSATALQERLDRQGIAPDILVNNAAFGLSGEFLSQDPARLREMLQLDVVSVVELTQVFGKRMAERASGHILLVASLAAYSPTPLLAAYGAAKQFVLAFGVALHVEMAPKVSVTVLSPGLMDTEFFEVSGYKPSAFLRRTMLAPSRVAEIGLKAMFAGRSSVVAGRMNRITAFSNRFTSRHLQAKLAYRMTKT